MIVTMKFSGNRMAVCICTMAVELQNEAVIAGTKGTIKVTHVFVLWAVLSTTCVFIESFH